MICVGIKYGCCRISFFLTNKVKEISFKMLHRFYPTNHYLQKLKKDIDVNCSFCGDQRETLVHLFWMCPHTRLLWSKLSKYIADHIYLDFMLKWENVLFGFVTHDMNFTSEFYLINLIIILTKFYIHKSKFQNKKPTFIELSVNVKQYISSISCSTNKKAVRSHTMFLLYNAFV